MKRVNFKNSRNLNLVGNLYESDSDSIVILSHALANDKSERGKLDKVANELNSVGFNVLAFDFIGCGESDDDTLTVSKQVDDLKSAIEFAKSLEYKKFGLFGHSIGALVSLKCYSPEISTMVLWSPVINKVHYTWGEKLTKEQLEQLDKYGYFIRTRKNAIRAIYKIDKQMLIDRESVDQEELLKNIDCPVLIIRGEKDTSIPLSDVQSAIKILKNSKLERVENANHDFNELPEHLDILVKLTKGWFLEHLEK